MKNIFVLLLGGVLVSTVGLSGLENDPKEEKQIMATLEIMAQATARKDIATLEKVYHPDLIYSHSSGVTQSKAEILKREAGPERTIVSMKFSDTNIHIYSSVALVNGIVDLRTSSQGRMGDVHLNVLWVLIKGPQGWQIVARQAVKVARQAVKAENP